MMSLSSGSRRSRVRGGSAGTTAGFPVSRPTSRASYRKLRNTYGTPLEATGAQPLQRRRR